ncbi:MAG: hypothetical protein ACM30E_09325 [Nitrososphaerales archaeon]
MNRRSPRILALLSVAVLALTLTLLFRGGESTRAMFQESALGTPTPATPEFVEPTVELIEPTAAIVATLEPPTSVPLPPEAGATPTPRGFLPAPTIVNPNDLHSLPLARPPVSSAGSLGLPTSAPTRAPAGATTLRAAVELLNYLWLLCGSALLIGGAIAIFLIWRRSQRT